MQIVTGKIKKPPCILVGGAAGSGKSTLAKSAKSPIFICGDEMDEFDVARFPKLTTFNMCLEQLDWLINNDHKFETVVIDTIDIVEGLAHQDILAKEKSDKTRVMTRACGGYAAAYDVALKMMTDIKNKLAKLRDNKNMAVIILCHTTAKTITDPILSDTYLEYSMALHEKVRLLFTSWVSAVLFIAIDMQKDTDDKFVYSDNKRIMYTQKIAGLHDAKNRYNLSPILPVPSDDGLGPFYKEFDEYFEGKQDVTKVIESIKLLIANLADDDLITKINDSLIKNKDNYAALVKMRIRVTELVSK